jgi:site-specific DNA recombinase
VRVPKQTLNGKNETDAAFECYRIHSTVNKSPKLGAVVYSRVSSEGQVKRNEQNLPMQLRICTDWCEQNRIPVLKVFTDAGQSAWAEKQNRPELDAMMAYLQQNKSKVSHVVVSELSRLARRVATQSDLESRFRNMSVRFVSVAEQMIDSTPTGKLTAHMLGGLNQYHSDALSERVKGRMLAAVEAGRFVWRAPLGYHNHQLNGTKNLIFDEERAPHVRKAFELLATGSHGLESVLQMVTAMGLRSRRNVPLRKQVFSSMMHNPCYAGWVVKGRMTKGAEIVKAKGNFEPMVTEETFNRVQDVLAGKRISVPHVMQNEDFPLRGFVHCYACQKPLTAGWAKGRNKKYARYWCWTKGCGSVAISKTDLEGHFISLLGSLAPTQVLLSQLPQIAKSTWSVRQERIAADKKYLSRLHADESMLHSRAVEARVKGDINQKDFEVLRDGITVKVETIEAQLRELELEKATMHELMQQAELRVLNLAQAWIAAGISERQEIQSAIFPDGLQFSSEKLFFEPSNKSLFSSLQELTQELVSSGRGERI